MVLLLLKVVSPDVSYGIEWPKAASDKVFSIGNSFISETPVKLFTLILKSVTKKKMVNKKSHNI